MIVSRLRLLRAVLSMNVLRFDQLEPVGCQRFSENFDRLFGFISVNRHPTAGPLASKRQMVPVVPVMFECDQRQKDHSAILASRRCPSISSKLGEYARSSSCLHTGRSWAWADPEKNACAPKCRSPRRYKLSLHHLLHWRSRTPQPPQRPHKGQIRTIGMLRLVASAERIDQQIAAHNARRYSLNQNRKKIRGRGDDHRRQ